MLNTQEVQGRWDTLRGKIKEKWGQLTDDDLQIAGGNVEQVIGRIEQKTGQQRREIEEFLNELMSEGGSALGRVKETAAGYAREAAEKVRGGYDEVAERAREGYRGAERLVQERPAESLGAMLALGLVAGVAVGLLLRSDS